MAADPLALLSTVEARAAVALAATDDRHDDRLDGLVAAVSRLIDERFGAMVERTVTAEQHDGGCGPDLWVRVPPVSAVTTVVEDGVTLVAADYLIRPGGERITRRFGDTVGHWKGFLLDVAVTYTAGRYADTASVDARVKEAARLAVRQLWRSEQMSTGRVDEYDAPAVVFPRVALPDAVNDLLGDLRSTPGMA